MAVVRSYVEGRWFAPDSGSPVYDAATGELVAEVSSEGIDFGAALAYGRGRGGPALRGMTFHERAELAKAVGQMLREHRDELYALSYRTGATKRDSLFDIDGGIGVLLGYASKAKRELPNDKTLVEGPPEQLGKKGQFLGQHLLTPLHGVAVQINAFNFPVWGPLEKLAPALIAGVPSLIKPASQTGYLTARLVELIIDSKILPDGALQLVSGSAGDLLNHLTEQDLLGFTGSACTAHQLRRHPNVVARSVRFNAEADSLNMSILGPGSQAFDRYVDQLVTEMTVKAGQKCTAIRRAFVPEGQIIAVADAVRERLESVVMGNPADPRTTMGPLASQAQRDEVRRSLKALESAARITCGGLERDTGPGAFMEPILLVADDKERAEVHEVEAFGPVATLIGYRDTADVIDLAGLGKGSLVGSVVTDDVEFAGEVIRSTAHWHGRLLVLDEDDAPESTGHGSPLPMLVHGGPGRAGGGEEMGGMRGVYHHMQRTAVQASPRMLQSVTGRWVKGAKRLDDGVHPFTKSLATLRIGDTITGGPRTVTVEDIEHFAEFTGDTFYAHTDEKAAAKNPFFGGRVAHGYLVLSFAAGLFVDPAPGPVLANYGIDNLRFLTPLKPGDEMTVTLTCKQISPRPGDYGEVRWDAEVTNGEGTVVASYDVLTMVAKEWDA
jgi:oxepin-CoA hydrolase/3-oxo-5,6-dehydrosuberyl-CoA semialdehyde dehydrogenase